MCDSAAIDEYKTPLKCSDVERSTPPAETSSKAGPHSKSGSVDCKSTHHDKEIPVKRNVSESQSAEMFTSSCVFPEFNPLIQRAAFDRDQ